jgi:hypothetical protein
MPDSGLWPERAPCLTPNSGIKLSDFSFFGMINTPDALYYQQYNATSNIKEMNSQ